MCLLLTAPPLTRKSPLDLKGEKRESLRGKGKGQFLPKHMCEKRCVKKNDVGKKMFALPPGLLPAVCRLQRRRKRRRRRAPRKTSGIGSCCLLQRFGSKLWHLSDQKSSFFFLLNSSRYTSKKSKHRFVLYHIPNIATCLDFSSRFASFSHLPKNRPSVRPSLTTLFPFIPPALQV